MKLYRKSGLIEDMLLLLEGVGSVSENVKTFQEFMDKADDKAAKVFDELVDKVLNMGGKELETARSTAKKGVRKALIETLNVLMYPMRKIAEETDGMLSFSDILSALSNEEDIVSIKTTTITADMFKAGKQAQGEKPVTYFNTLSGMNDAVYNYNNAPRAENATHLTVFCAVPTGIHRYLARQVTQLARMANDPVYKGLGLNSLSDGDGALQGALKMLGKYLGDGLEDALYKEKELIASPPVLKRSALLSASRAHKDIEAAINSYRWYIESEFEPNPVIPVTKDHKRMLRFSIAGDPDNELKLVEEEAYTDYYIAEGVMVPESREGVHPRLFSTQLGGTLRKASLRMDVLREIFDAEKAYDVFKVFEKGGTTLFLEYWEYEFDPQGRVVLTSMDDMRVVSMNPSVKDTGESWLGVGVGGLGSLFPSLDELADQVQNMLEELIKSAIKLEDLAQSVLTDFFNLILAILKRVAQIMRYMFDIILLILKIVLAFDVRYAVFHGSYSDIPTVWRMVRGDYKLVEAMGNSVFALVITAKGDYYPRIEKALDKKKDIVIRLLAKKKLREIPGLQGVGTVAPPPAETNGFSPPVINSDAPDVTALTLQAAGTLNTAVYLSPSVKKGSRDRSGVHRITIPVYTGN
jgi:hypothetical protein